ncbi:hypothetical protein J3R82DRAFT_11454 [Butyriboletus roseoflavus]|nr:hypothetical protein J3R82DRAFT_11454 [Butyriboletus roseoflavus]
MKFVGHCPVLFLAMVPCRVLAFPLAHTSTVAVKTYIPLIVISISLFFLVGVFLAIKLVYMKHRRIGTIHAPPNRNSSLGFRDKKGARHRGLLVGCLGSPVWETNLTSKLDGATWGRERRRGYHLHAGSTTRSTHAASVRLKSSASSRLTKSTWSSGADQLVLPLSSGPSRIPTSRGGSSLKALCSVQQISSTDFHVRYGDFGESHPGGGVPDVARRASPSSIRLVGGPSHSNQVEYSFLSSLPPNAIVVSPLMGTRDSFQLSLKCNRKPVPPMPPLPLFLPFYLPKSPETVESQPLQASGSLPLLRFSPLASVAKVFHSQQQVVEKKVDTGSHPTRETNHKESQSCKGLAIGGLSPRTTTDEGAAALPPEDNESCDGSVSSKKVLKSCLRQKPTRLVCSPDFTPLMSESSAQTYTGDSVQTPISEVDIGILGLDRFCWNKEPKMRSCHAKKDSVAVVTF